MFRARFIFDGKDKYQEIQETMDSIISGEYYLRKPEEPEVFIP